MGCCCCCEISNNQLAPSSSVHSSTDYNGENITGVSNKTLSTGPFGSVSTHLYYCSFTTTIYCWLPVPALFLFYFFLHAL